MATKGKGLTKETIVSAALELVEEKGYNNFSVRELAQRLHVKAASLYNHLNSIDEVNREIGQIAVRRMNAFLMEAAKGKERDEAIRAIGYAYREFAKNEREMYRAIMGMPGLNQDGSLELGRESVVQIRETIAQYKVSRKNAVKFSRCFRGALHGYISLEAAGYFTATNVTVDESFDFLIDDFVERLHIMEEKEESEAVTGNS